MITKVDNLLLSGSKSMNVNGSGSSKTFSYSASQSTSVLGLYCILKDEGTTSFDKFGSITGLTSGINIKTTISGNESTITNIKTNSDLCTRFHSNHFGSSAVLSILSVVTPLGFGNSNNVFVGYMEFLPTRDLILDNGDTVYAVVQDDLTSIDVLEMSIKYCIDQ